MGQFPACSRQGWESWSPKDLAMLVSPLLSPRRRWAEPTAKETTKRLGGIWRTPLLTACLGYDTRVTWHCPAITALPRSCFACVCNEKGIAGRTPAGSTAAAKEFFSPPQRDPYFACLGTELPTCLPCRQGHRTDLPWKHHKQLPPPPQEGSSGCWPGPRRRPRPAEMRHYVVFAG